MVIIKHETNYIKDRQRAKLGNDWLILKLSGIQLFHFIGTLRSDYAFKQAFGTRRINISQNKIIKIMADHSEELISQWKTGHRTLDNMLSKINDDNIGNRLHPEANSVGFLVRHIAEVEHGFSHSVFKGPELTYDRITVGPGITDTGVHTNVEELKNMLAVSGTALENAFKNLTKEDWDEKVEMRMGTFSRRDFVAYLIAHSSYHNGQIGLSLKYGK